jgi:hypothetical protein
MTASTLWQIPADVWDIGTRARIPYTPGPPATEGTGQRAIDPRIRDIHAQVAARWPQVPQFWEGGRAWNGQANIDIHLAGRGLDIMVPDRATGDEIAAWLMWNLDIWDLQYLIWYKVQWGTVAGTDRRQFSEYFGSSDHRDHVHVEVAPPGVHVVLPSSGGLGRALAWGGGLLGAGLAAGWAWDRVRSRRR